MVVSQFFWCLTYIPFVPATPVQLVLAVWILLPNNEGEKVVYLAMSGYLSQFEIKVTHVKYSFFSYILKFVLKLSHSTSDYCATRISSERLAEFRDITK